jgi:hypothetical protein
VLVAPVDGARVVVVASLSRREAPVARVLGVALRNALFVCAWIVVVALDRLIDTHPVFVAVIIGARVVIRAVHGHTGYDTIDWIAIDIFAAPANVPHVDTSMRIASVVPVVAVAVVALNHRGDDQVVEAVSHLCVAAIHGARVVVVTG